MGTKSGGAAFPVPEERMGGLSKREYYAAMAMQGLTSQGYISEEKLAADAFKMADAMLAESVK